MFEGPTALTKPPRLQDGEPKRRAYLAQRLKMDGNKVPMARPIRQWNWRVTNRWPSEPCSYPCNAMLLSGTVLPSA